jgi:hypothetical protein
MPEPFSSSHNQEAQEISGLTTRVASALLETTAPSGIALLRLLDYLKAEQITTLFTNLTHGMIELGATDPRRVIAHGYLVAPVPAGNSGRV